MVNKCIKSNACPNETTVRPTKTSKESIVGLVAALKIFEKDGDYPENVNAIATYFRKMNLLLNKSENKLLNKYIQLNVNTVLRCT